MSATTVLYGRNAIREAPQDPVLRARLADVYLQLGDAVSAEREARFGAKMALPGPSFAGGQA